MKVFKYLKDHVVQTVSGISMSVAFLAMIAWALEKWAFLALGMRNVPIAPITSFFFLIINISLFLHAKDKTERPLFDWGVIAVFLLYFFTRVIEWIWHIPISPDELFFPLNTSIEGIIVGRMSPFVAIAFALYAISMALQFCMTKNKHHALLTSSFINLFIMIFGFTVVSSYITGLPLFYNYLTVPVALLTGILLCCTSFAMTYLLPGTIWPHTLLSFSSDSVAHSKKSYHRAALSAFGFYILTMGIIALLYLRAETHTYKQSVSSQLESISELKEEQITWWLKERLGDAKVLKSMPFVNDTALDIIASSASETQTEDMHSWMQQFTINYGYCSMFMVDLTGKALIGVPTGLQLNSIDKDPHFQRAQQSMDIVLTDIQVDQFHTDKRHHARHIRLWIPILKHLPQSDIIVGMWLLQIDPDVYLYPLIQTFPTPTKSAETLLVRKDGDRVLFLNDLRHRKDTALQLSLPISKYSNTPAVKAVGGYEGFMEGTDYRGKQVLAITRNIKINDWYLITKIDLDEIYYPLRKKGWITGSALLLLVLISSYFFELIVQRKEDSEQLLMAKQWETTFDSVSDVIWHLDTSFRITRANLTTLKTLGIAPNEAIGKHCWQVVHQTESLHPDCPYYTVAKTGKSASRDIKINGNWFSVTLDPIYDSLGMVAGHVHVIRDINKQKLAEESIRNINSILEQRVKDRTLELETAVKELEAFSYSVSHDLRAPLRAIDGWSMILGEEIGSELSPEAVSMIDRVRKETQKMGNLIDSLIRLSKMSRMDLQIAEINLSEMCMDIVNRLRINEVGRNFEFHIQDDIIVKADPTLMEAVLTNLLANAFKFSIGSNPAIIEFGKKTLDKQICYYVKDNGVGFDMRFVHKLFGTFQRLHKNSEFPGSGIGLATVKRIIERHGGNIWADSEIDHYAMFCFTLRM